MRTYTAKGVAKAIIRGVRATYTEAAAQQKLLELAELLGDCGFSLEMALATSTTTYYTCKEARARADLRLLGDMSAVLDDACSASTAPEMIS